MSLTKQKNYVHAQQNSIPESTKKSYEESIQVHHKELHRLIESTGDVATAKKMQKRLTNIRKEALKTQKTKSELDQEIMKFLKNPKRKKLYDSFLNAILDDFSNISVDREKLLTDNLTINPDAIHSARVDFRKVKGSENYHVLGTIMDRYWKAREALRGNEIKDAKIKKNIEDNLKLLDEIIAKYSNKQFIKTVELHNMTVQPDKEKKIWDYRRIQKKQFDDKDDYKALETALEYLYTVVRSVDIVNNLEARIREIIVTMMIETGDDISNKAIMGAIEKASAANKQVELSFDEKVTGELFRKEAKNYTQSHYTKKVGDNDFYIDFGAKQVKNKIDGYITIHDKETNIPKQVGISIKSYSILYGKTNKVTLADTLNLLSLILGMNSIDRSYAFLNTIAPREVVIGPERENKQREKALNILKTQAVYAAATGHLGGRQLLNNTDKAEYLVIEDKTSPNVFVYAMSTIIKNADKYISINPNPFKTNTYEKYFTNDYIGKEKDYLKAMKRNTLLLIKLRQTKLDIGVKKSALKNAALLTDNNLIPYDNK